MMTDASGARSAMPTRARILRATIAAVLAFALVPLTGGASAGQAHADEAAKEAKAGPQISVTAPFWITFASEDAPYDVADPQPSVTAQSYFKNSGSEGITLYSVECLPPEGAAADLSDLPVESTNASKPLTGEQQKLFSMWDDAAGDGAAIDFGYYNAGGNAISVQNGSMSAKMGVDEGQTLSCSYRLNLSNDDSLAEAAIKESAAKPADAQERQPLGTFKFTFSAWYPPLGFGDLTGMPADELAQQPFYFKDARQSRADRQEVYSLAQIKDMSARLTEADAAGGKDALYDELCEFIKDPDGYECRVMYGAGQLPVRLIGILQDQISGSGGKQAGLTFQFCTAIAQSPLAASAPADATACTWPHGAGAAGEELAAGGEWYANLGIAGDTLEVSKRYARNPSSSSAASVGSMRMRLFLPSRYELGGANALDGDYASPDGASASYSFSKLRPWIAREGTGKAGTEQYQFYAEHAGSPSESAALAIGGTWWTRTPWPQAAYTDFSVVDANGGILGGHLPSTSTAGVVPCFCL